MDPNELDPNELEYEGDCQVVYKREAHRTPAGRTVVIAYGWSRTGEGVGQEAFREVPRPVPGESITVERGGIGTYYVTGSFRTHYVPVDGYETPLPELTAQFEDQGYDDPAGSALESLTKSLLHTLDGEMIMSTVDVFMMRGTAALHLLEETVATDYSAHYYEDEDAAAAVIEEYHPVESLLKAADEAAEEMIKFLAAG